VSLDSSVGRPPGRVSERDPLLDHSGSEEDTEGNDEESGSLIEAMHPLAPQDLRPGDEESVDDELALPGPRDEQEEADRCNQATPDNVPNREVDVEELHSWSLIEFTECLIQDVTPNHLESRG